MDKFDSAKLNSKYISSISAFIRDKQSEISEICINQLIRDDIFPLLDKYCTVIYFPKEDKENNGFHKTYFFEDKEKHFVYINTAQHKEKQIFTAAHELGHIWPLKQFVEANTGKKFDSDIEERTVNRFASELLMPSAQFRPFVQKELSLYLNEDNSISEVDMIKVITSTMNHFFTSYKSVIYRFYEIGILEEKHCRMLWGETEEHSRESLIEMSIKIAREKGYGRLYQTDERKWINGLKELLDTAKENDVFSNDWLEVFYQKFDFDSKPNEVTLDETLSINLVDGAGNDE